MQIPEEVKVKIKEMAIGTDRKEFFDSHERHGMFAIAVYGKYPVNQEMFVVEYRLTRNIVYDILES